MAAATTAALLLALTQPSVVVRPNPAKVREFVEPAAIYAASKVESVALSLPSGLAAGPIESSFISTGVPPKEGTPPIIILHSFDSSCLEWRRVLPLLEEMGLEAYMLDILGWGFTDTANAQTVGVEAKREHLRAFWTQHLGGRAAMLVGSSLGAATIIDFASVLPAAGDQTWPLIQDHTCPSSPLVRPSLLIAQQASILPFEPRGWKSMRSSCATRRDS